MSAPYDVLYRYTAGVRSGLFDRDLSEEERATVVRLLECGLNILQNYGGTPGQHLARMLRDPQVPPFYNDRVRDIVETCVP